jgi:molecular chaperone IbpA
MTTLELPALQSATIGFDRLFDELDRQYANSKSNGYPPYNLAELNENEWMISVAVAGFSDEDLDVTIDRNILTIEGSAPQGDDSVNYLYKGIAGRSFRRQFTLADYVYVEDASLDRGILNVHLKREVPEELQPKSIRINTTHQGSIEDKS